MFDVNQFVRQFVAAWNKPHSGRRSEYIRGLWAPDGAHISKGRNVIGYDAILERISGSYKRSVERGGNSFVSAGNADRLDHIVKFNGI